MEDRFDHQATLPAPSAPVRRPFGKFVLKGAFKGSLILATLFVIGGVFLSYMAQREAFGKDLSWVGNMFYWMVFGAIAGGVFGAIGGAMDWLMGRAKERRA